MGQWQGAFTLSANRKCDTESQFKSQAKGKVKSFLA